MKAQVADAFLERFQLKATEIEVLRGSREGALHVVSVRDLSLFNDM